MQLLSFTAPANPIPNETCTFGLQGNVPSLSKPTLADRTLRRLANLIPNCCLSVRTTTRLPSSSNIRPPKHFCMQAWMSDPKRDCKVHAQAQPKDCISHFEEQFRLPMSSETSPAPVFRKQSCNSYPEPCPHLPSHARPANHILDHACKSSPNPNMLIRRRSVYTHPTPGLRAAKGRGVAELTITITRPRWHIAQQVRLPIADPIAHQNRSPTRWTKLWTELWNKNKIK